MTLVLILSDGGDYTTFNYKYLLKNPSTARILLHSNVLEYQHSKINTQV